MVTNSNTYSHQARIPGLMWTVAGTDENDLWIRWQATFMTMPLEMGKTLSVHPFQ